MDQHYKDLIANEFRNCVNNTITRIQNRDGDFRPFHSALLSEDVIFWSAFERSFSTSFGQRVLEELAKIVALSNGADDAARQRETTVTLDNAYFAAINSHITSLRSNRNATTGWDASLTEVRDIELTGQTNTIRVISDLWWIKDGVNNYMSLKTVKPNIDQTCVAKEDCLKLKLYDPNCNAYFGLPYNPYGDNREDYAFNPPMKVFDFHHDSAVLIGRDMWDTLGGAGCYDEIIEIAEAVGIETRQTIAALR